MLEMCCKGSKFYDPQCRALVKVPTLSCQKKETLYSIYYRSPSWGLKLSSFNKSPAHYRDPESCVPSSRLFEVLEWCVVPFEAFAE